MYRSPSQVTQHLIKRKVLAIPIIPTRFFTMRPTRMPLENRLWHCSLVWLHLTRSITSWARLAVGALRQSKTVEVLPVDGNNAHMQHLGFGNTEPELRM